MQNSVAGPRRGPDATAPSRADACARAVAAFFADALAERAAPRRMSAANWLEAAVVIEAARDPVASRRFDDLVAAADIAIEPATAEQAAIARAAYRDYGKGGGHPAQLDVGDCFACALAQSSVEPLLRKDDDVVCTDVKVHQAG
jgi:ribonuclease VapC